MPQSVPYVLLVEDTAPLACIYQQYLQADGYKVVTEDVGRGAMARLDHGAPVALILDLLLPDVNGLEVLDYAHRLYPDLPIIVVTVTNSIDVAVEAMRRGAYDYIVKPFTSTRLTTTLRNALEHKDLAREVTEWRQILGHEKFHRFVGQSPAMQSVYRTIDAVAASKASVFLLGENGTGKEMAAEAIHRASPRRDQPFVPLNCAAIPHDLLESTIFGHVKGAFTGAVSDQIGAAKAAHGGTLFLDEICEMPVDLQTKLLRFVQTGEIMPVGGQRADYVDVRIISATNRDPAEEIANRRFREDLFYRLHVVPVELPPLRDRGDDVLILASHFLARFNAEETKSFTGLSPEVASLFRRYEWPGNVRQLENVLRNVVVLHDGPTVTEDLLPKNFQDFIATRDVPAANQNAIRLQAQAAPDEAIQPLWLMEKQAILAALDHTGHDIPRAAVLLEVSPSTLYRKLQAWKAEFSAEEQPMIA